MAQDPCLFAAQDHIENPLGFQNHGVADAEIAVGTERILTCSNSWLRLLFKDGSPALPPQIRQAKLGNYNPGSLPYPFFFPIAGNPGPNDFVFIGDPMVYFDYEDERFWVVAVEVHAQIFVGSTHSRVQIAVSTSATPTDWTNSWH